MKKLTALLVFIVVISGCNNVSENKIIPNSQQSSEINISTQVAEPKPKFDEELLQLSQQFKAARSDLKDHKRLYPESESLKFKQASQQYSTILKTFEKKLGQPLYTKNDIIMLMGEPDNMYYGENSTYLVLSYDTYPGIPKVPNELIFVCENGIVQEAHFRSV